MHDLRETMKLFDLDVLNYFPLEIPLLDLLQIEEICGNYEKSECSNIVDKEITNNAKELEPIITNTSTNLTQTNPAPINDISQMPLLDYDYIDPQSPRSLSPNIRNKLADETYIDDCQDAVFVSPIVKPKSKFTMLLGSNKKESKVPTLIQQKLNFQKVQQTDENLDHSQVQFVETVSVSDNMYYS